MEYSAGEILETDCEGATARNPKARGQSGVLLKSRAKTRMLTARLSKHSGGVLEAKTP